MIIRHFYTPGLAINSYLVFEEGVKRAAVIDPSRNIEAILAAAMQEGVEITDILETHVHADFLSGALELKQALENKPEIHCSGMGGKEWTPSYADHIVEDRDEVVVGPVRLQAWHTPGHTPEHVIWVAYDEKRSASTPEAVFTGDLLFVGSIGRPDLLGDEAEKKLAKQLYDSLFQVMKQLPDYVEIYPAHGAGSLCGKEIGKRTTSTLGYERQCNPGLAPKEYEQWLQMLRKGMPVAPKYFPVMKRMNLTGPSEREHEEMPLPIVKERLKKEIASNLVVDVRGAEAFAEGNIKGSINVPFGMPFSLWAGSVLPYDKPLLIVVDHSDHILPVIEALRLIGLDNVTGFIGLDRFSQEDKANFLTPSPMMDVKALNAQKEKYYILDVRTPGEWNEGHIAEAHSMELATVVDKMKTISTDKPVAVLCARGNRASIVASILAKEMGLNTINVKGGMQAWIDEKLPTTH